MSSIKQPSRMRAPARREQLLDVAIQLAVERGFHAVSVEAVARGAGVTRAVIYKHVGDREELLEVAVRREMNRALSQVSETALSTLRAGSEVELMIESLSSYLYTVKSHPRTWRLVLMPTDGAPKALANLIDRGRRQVLSGLVDAISPVLDAGEESADTELTARLLSATADHYARLVLSDPERFEPERLIRHARWILEREGI